MNNPIKKIKEVKEKINGNIQKAKYFIIAMSTLQILTFIMVIILLILFFTRV